MKHPFAIRAGLSLAAALLSVQSALAQSAPTPPPAKDDDDLEVPAGPQQPAPPPAERPAPAPAEPDAAIWSKLGDLEREAKAADSRASQAEARAEAAESRAAAADVRARAAENSAGREEGILAGFLTGFHISGYVQPQYEASQMSEDQLAQGGGHLNQDQFVLRRGRVAVEREWTHSSVAVEIDANTNRGASVGLRRVEASLFWRTPDTAEEAPPAVALTAGLTDIPFGYELAESARKRLFMERSTASLALFPGEADLGARVWGGAGFFRYAVAVLAGEPVSERTGRSGAGDPNAAKDLVARVGVASRPAPAIQLDGGVSLLGGTGFHPGTDATKGDIEWRDLNENGTIDTGELMSLPGTAATPSENFRRWAVGADLELGVRTPIGLSRLLAEATIASNLDRGLFVADPVETGVDLRHLGAYLALVHEIEWGLGGLRVDLYNPNLDFFDERAGVLVPTDSTITTISPLLGGNLPWRAKLFAQFDWIIDHLARDARGVPTDLANNRFTVRLQVEL